jgi:hypothetical protein
MAESTTAPNRLIRANDFRTIFANSFRVRVSNNDISVTFGYQSTMPDGSPVLTDEVEIVTTLLGFKILVESLKGIVESIEKSSGEIPVPEALKQTEALLRKKP